ncbi:MAG: InlB B-repeat-containing protein [Coprobacillaceae bacterium]
MNGHAGHGGAIYTENIAALSVESTVIFTGNKSDQFWIAEWELDPAIIQVHGDKIQIPEGTFSVPADRNRYIYNNYDVYYYEGVSRTNVRLNYDENGGTGSMSDASKIYPYRTEVTVRENEFTAPTNKYFVRWDTKADGTGTSYDPEDLLTLTGNVTLYAQWEAIPTSTSYNIVYEPNDGVGTTYTTSSLVGREHTVLSNTNSNLGYQRTNYTLLGWSTNSAATTAEYTGTGSERIGSTAVTGDTITLYAVWQRDTYTVKYKANNGTSSEYVVSNNVGTGHTVLSNTDSNLGFEKANHTFVGWAGSSDATVAEYTGNEVIGARANKNVTYTLYAVWKRDTYIVKYNANNGVSSEYTTSNNVGTGHTVLPNTDSNLGFEKLDYTFLGWSTDSNATVAEYTGNETIGTTAIKNGIITLYAVWKRDTYTVKYNANSGIGSEYTTNNNVGTGHIVLSNTNSNLGYERTHYTFLGWSTDSAATVAEYTGSETIGTTTAKNGIITLYAVWKRDTYIVKYNVNNGVGSEYTVGNNVGEGHIVLSNADSNLGYERTNYTLLGWSTDSNATVAEYTGSETIGTTTAKNGVITLYAIWERDTYTVKYNANTGIRSEYVVSNNVGEGHIVLSNADSNLGYQKLNHTFLGWSTDSTATTAEYAAGQIVGATSIKNGVITLYAVWERDAYKITYNSNNEANLEYEIDKNVGDNHSVLPNTDSNLEYDKTNYTFLVWSTNSNATTAEYTGDEIIGDSAVKDGVITLYAVWRRDTYIIKYNANDETTREHSVNGNVGDSHIVLSNTDTNLGYERTDYTFLGWSTDSNATVAEYVGSEGIGATAIKDSVITLYAIWQRDTNIQTYTVIFDSQGGSTVNSITNITNNSKINEPSNPIREGYKFTGWYLESVCHNVWDFDNDRVTSNMTLYAKWEKVTDKENPTTPIEKKNKNLVVNLNGGGPNTGDGTMNITMLGGILIMSLFALIKLGWKKRATKIE